MVMSCSVTPRDQDVPSKPDVCQRVEPLYSEKTPQDAELELQQCISRMVDRQPHSEDKKVQHIADSKTTAQETLRKPKTKAPKPKPPVRTSSIEQKKSAPSLQQKQLIPQSKPQPTDQPRVSQGMKHKQQLGQFDSATSCPEAYATLPRKPGQRASHKVGLDTDVYESYLQRQRAATTCMPGTVATSGGRGMKDSGDMAPRSQSNSSSSYKCPSVEQSLERSAPHPGIMEQLIREGLIDTYTALIDSAALQKRAPGGNLMRSCSNTPVNGDMARDSERHVRHANLTGPEQSIDNGRQTPSGDVRLTLKQKQQAVTQALYYGRPTAAVTQPTASDIISHRGIYLTVSSFVFVLYSVSFLFFAYLLTFSPPKIVYLHVYLVASIFCKFGICGPLGEK